MQILKGTKPECVRKMIELEAEHGKHFRVISMDDSKGTYLLEASTEYEARIKAQARIEKLSKLFDQQNERAVKAEAEVVSFSSKLASEEERALSFYNQLCEAQARIENLKGQCESQERNLEEWRKIDEAQSRKLFEAEAHSKALQKELSIIRQRLDQAQAQAQYTNELESRLSAMSKDLEGTIESQLKLFDQERERANKAEARKDRALQVARKLRLRNHNQESVIRSLQKEALELEAQAEQAREDYSILEARSQAEASSLQEALTKAEEKAEELQRALDSRLDHRNLREARENLKFAREQVYALSGQLESTKSKLQALQAIEEAESKALDQARKELEAAKAHKLTTDKILARLEAENNQRLEEFEALELASSKALKEAQAERSRQASRICELEAQAKAQARTIESLRAWKLSAQRIIDQARRIQQSKKEARILIDSQARKIETLETLLRLSCKLQSPPRDSLTEELRKAFLQSLQELEGGSLIDVEA